MINIILILFAIIFKAKKIKFYSEFPISNFDFICLIFFNHLLFMYLFTNNVLDLSLGCKISLFNALLIRDEAFSQILYHPKE